MPDKPEHVDRVEFVRSFAGYEDNLRMHGHLYASHTGRTVGGWLVSSWSQGAPYWQPEQHWFDKGENKFYHAVFNIDRRSTELRSGEDKDIHPNRAAFIRKMTGKWESEWLQGHQDGPGS